MIKQVREILIDAYKKIEDAMDKPENKGNDKMFVGTCADFITKCPSSAREVLQ